MNRFIDSLQHVRLLLRWPTYALLAVCLVLNLVGGSYLNALYFLFLGACLEAVSRIVDYYCNTERQV